jgi:hypothetical protein
MYEYCGHGGSGVYMITHQRRHRRRPALQLEGRTGKVDVYSSAYPVSMNRLLLRIP